MSKITSFPRSLCNRLAVLCQGTHKFRSPNSFGNTAEVLAVWRVCVQIVQRTSGGKMLARLMVAVRGSGLGVRASADGLLRVAGAGCPGLRQQRQASTAEVSGAWWW